jgi:phage terminase large subunit
MESRAMEITPEEAIALIEGYVKRPSEYIQDVYGSKLWWKQQEIVEAVFKYRNVSVKSCNAVGKSYIAARVAHSFLMLHPGSIVVTTAPTARQVRDILWREIGTTHNMAKYPLGGHLTQLGLEFDKDWYAVGLSTTEPEKFFGYHSDHILVVVDEASGVDEQIFKGVRAITPNENAHTLLIGNPTNPDGTFFQSFSDPRVKTFTISAFDTPNMVANEIRNVSDLVRVFTPPEGVHPLDHNPKFKLPYPALISPTAVYERLQEWGAESPFFQALVLGQFPEQAEFALIPLNLIQSSMDEDYRKEHKWHIPDGPLEYGVDVARFGMDKTVLIARHGGKVDYINTWSKKDTDWTADRIIEAMNLDEWNSVVKVDDTGVGGGVTDKLNRIRRDDNNTKYHYHVVAIDFGSGPDNPLKFYNKRAEMYWNLRDLFFKHAIALPKDNELANELASIQFKPFAGKDGQIIKIESKDNIRDRLGRSPDKADALALAFASSGQGRWRDIPEATSLEYDKPLTAGFNQTF